MPKPSVAYAHFLLARSQAASCTAGREVPGRGAQSQPGVGYLSRTSDSLLRPCRRRWAFGFSQRQNPWRYAPPLFGPRLAE